MITIEIIDADIIRGHQLKNLRKTISQSSSCSKMRVVCMISVDRKATKGDDFAFSKWNFIFFVLKIPNYGAFVHNCFK